MIISIEPTSGISNSKSHDIYVHSYYDIFVVPGTLYLMLGIVSAMVILIVIISVVLLICHIVVRRKKLLVTLEEGMWN